MKMEITFFYWSQKCGKSINRSFANLVNYLRHDTSLTIKEYYVPHEGSNPINLLKNIIFVYKHRTSKGINHITGDIHYCILGLIGCKSVLTIHDDYSYRQAKKGFIGKIYKYIFWIYLPIKFANISLCITQSTKDNIYKLYSSKKLKVFTNHTWPKEYKYCPKDFNYIQPVILHISTGENKNLETTIQALNGINAKLIVVEKMTDAQIKLAQSLKIDFYNTGRISDEEILNLYKQADIISFPSSYEGFGMPIVEGQLIGRCVITTNLPPMNWVAGDGSFLINNPRNPLELKQVILKIIHNKKERENCISKGLINAQRFSIEKTANELLNIYNNI